jgi:hypothetical protein
MWQVYSDLKIAALLLNFHGGFTKYCCFLYLWGSRDTGNHYLGTWPHEKLC